MPRASWGWLLLLGAMNQIVGAHSQKRPPFSVHNRNPARGEIGRHFSGAGNAQIKNLIVRFFALTSRLLQPRAAPSAAPAGQWRPDLSDSILGHLNAHPRYGEDGCSFRIGELKDPVVSPMVQLEWGSPRPAAKQPIAAEGRPSKCLGVIHSLPTGYFACRKHLI